MNNNVTPIHQNQNRLETKRRGDSLLLTETSHRLDYIRAAAGTAMQAVSHENPRIARDEDISLAQAAHATPEQTSPALTSVPTGPDALGFTTEQAAVAEPQPAHNPDAFLLDARSQVFASLPTEQQNYVNNHPRVDAVVEPHSNPLFGPSDGLGYEDEIDFDPLANDFAELGYENQTDNEDLGYHVAA